MNKIVVCHAHRFLDMYSRLDHLAEARGVCMTGLECLRHHVGLKAQKVAEGRARSLATGSWKLARRISIRGGGSSEIRTSRPIVNHSLIRRMYSKAPRCTFLFLTALSFTAVSQLWRLLIGPVICWLGFDVIDSQVLHS